MIYFATLLNPGVVRKSYNLFDAEVPRENAHRVNTFIFHVLREFS